MPFESLEAPRKPHCVGMSCAIKIGSRMKFLSRFKVCFLKFPSILSKIKQCLLHAFSILTGWSHLLETYMKEEPTDSD